MQLRKGTARVLNAHRALFRIALSASNIFAWMIVFQFLFVTTAHLEVALAGVAALYGISNAVTFFLTPLSGMALRHGVRRALTIGTMTAALAFGLLASVFLYATSIESMYWVIASFVVVRGIYRALYWIPYKTTDRAKKGGASHIQILDAVLILMPAFAGYLLSFFSHGAFVLFGTTSALLILSGLLLTRLPESYESFTWSYAATFRALTQRANTTAVGLFILDGMQGAVLLLIWPLAAFILLGKSFSALGIVLSATLLLTILTRYLVQETVRTRRMHDSPIVVASVVFSSWMLRLAAASPVQVTLIDVFYNTGTSAGRFSVDAQTYEQTADNGHYIDEYTALKEMGLCIGKIAIALLFFILALSTSESVAFTASILTAALAGGWSILIAEKVRKAL